MVVTEDIIQSKIMPVTETGCWIWLGGTVENGYGYWGGEVAHRRVYKAMVGPIAAGLQLDHLCNVRCCVNPQHLEPVTEQENRARASRRRNGVYRPRVTHCLRGHALSAENTRTYHRRLENGSMKHFRVCKTCQKQIQERHKIDKDPMSFGLKHLRHARRILTIANLTIEALSIERRRQEIQNSIEKLYKRKGAAA